MKRKFEVIVDMPEGVTPAMIPVILHESLDSYMVGLRLKLTPGDPLLNIDTKKIKIRNMGIVAQ